MRLGIAFLAAAALAACASTETQTAAPEGRDCFNTRAISGYNSVDENHVTVSVGANRRYILTTMFNARDLDWTETIALRSTSGWICTGNGIGVEVIGGRPQRNYPITAIERAPDAVPNSDQGS